MTHRLPARALAAGTAIAGAAALVLATVPGADAQKTDSKQTNKNLVLSEDAVINTKPELRIFADDVRCTHGATIGQLEEEAIFYARSRGIPQAQARGLLIYAFAKELIDRIPAPSLHTHLEAGILDRLSRARHLEEIHERPSRDAAVHHGV